MGKVINTLNLGNRNGYGTRRHEEELTGCDPDRYQVHCNKPMVGIIIQQPLLTEKASVGGKTEQEDKRRQW
jgi:hypothetical protein